LNEYAIKVVDFKADTEVSILIPVKYEAIKHRQFYRTYQDELYDHK